MFKLQQIVFIYIIGNFIGTDCKCIRLMKGMHVSCTPSLKVLISVSLEENPSTNNRTNRLVLTDVCKFAK